MHRVIIIGAGEVGQHIARRLSSEGHNVTVVDAEIGRVEAAQAELDALVILGNGASPRLLTEIGIEKADLLLAVTTNDETNLIATLVGHQLGAKKTVARVRDPDFFADASFAHDRLGIDFIIHPERATAYDLTDAIELPGAVAVEYFGDDKVAVAECVITEESPLVGIPLDQRQMSKPHFIAGLISKGSTCLATPDSVLEVGDRIFVAVATENVNTVVAEIAGQAQVIRDVIIFGGGRIGLPLARSLEELGKYNITVLESDGERARYIAERLPRTTVVHEAGIGKDLFLAHGIDNVGAFVACAGDDRNNLLAARYAKELGANLCLTVVSREEYVPLVAGLGIDAAFSPRLVTADTILRFIRGEHVRAMHLLFGGAEVLEVSTDAGSRMDGRSCLRPKLPKGSQIAAIVRGDEVFFPLSQQTILPDDRVVIFGIANSCVNIENLFDA